MKIGIDVDEIVVEFTKGYLRFYTAKYNKKVLFENLFSYDLWLPLGISKEEAFELAEEYYNSKDFENIEVVEGAVQGINDLAEENEIFFITSRPVKIKQKTYNFLKAHFPNLNLKLIHSKHYQLPGKKKSELCKELGISFLIEDDERNVLDCAKEGVKVIVLSKPWNKNLQEQSNIIKANNWREVPSLIK